MKQPKKLINEELFEIYIKHILTVNNYDINSLSYDIISKKNNNIKHEYLNVFNFIQGLAIQDLIDSILKHGYIEFVNLDVTNIKPDIINIFINDTFDNKDRSLSCVTYSHYNSLYMNKINWIAKKK
jgi:hypothetical protein